MEKERREDYKGLKQVFEKRPSHLLQHLLDSLAKRRFNFFIFLGIDVLICCIRSQFGTLEPAVADRAYLNDLKNR